MLKRRKKTVLISNIPSSLNWKDIKGVFCACGVVEFCQIDPQGRAELVFATPAVFSCRGAAAKSLAS